MDGCIQIYFFKCILTDFLSSKASCLADHSLTQNYMELKKPEKGRSVKFRELCCWRLEFLSVLPCGQQNTEHLTQLNLGLWLLWYSGSLWSWRILVLLNKKEDVFISGIRGILQSAKKVSKRNI